MYYIGEAGRIGGKRGGWSGEGRGEAWERRMRIEFSIILLSFMRSGRVSS